MASGLDRQFWVAWIQMCQRLGCDPTDLAKISYSESGLNPAAYNPSGPAGGLIQFMYQPLRGVGFSGTVMEFTRLSGLQQLPYIEKYYAPFRRYLTDVGLMYTVNFLPAYASAASAAAAKGMDFVYAEKNGIGYSAVIYKFNTGLDQNRDGKISHQDLISHIHSVTSTPRWAAIAQEITDAAEWLHGAEPRPPAPTVQPFNWRKVNSIRQVQHALNFYYWHTDSKTHATLAEDGQYGPKTKAAVQSFQTETGLLVDGLPGPKTRGMLAKKLWLLRKTAVAEHH